MKRVKAFIAIILQYTQKKRKKIKNRRWVKEWILQRQRFTQVNLLDYINEVEPADLKNYYRMESETYQELLDLVTLYIENKSTNMREAIPAPERLLSRFSTSFKNSRSENIHDVGSLISSVELPVL
nr:unnamed protein product [Callosobruchus chinensis]